MVQKGGDNKDEDEEKEKDAVEKKKKKRHGPKRWNDGKRKEKGAKEARKPGN